MVNVKKKIDWLLKNKYKEAAFSNKKNAETFAKGWQEKGYQVGYIRSSGPTIEGNHRRKAYYMIAKKKFKR